MRKILAIACLSVFLLQPAMADKRIFLEWPEPLRITNDQGGAFSDYFFNAGTYRLEKRKIIIDGVCASACTLYLFPDLELDVCATPRAILEFHMPYMVNGHTKEPIRNFTVATHARILWDSWVARYPSKIGAWLRGQQVPSVSEGANPWDVVSIIDPAKNGFVKACSGT